MICCSHSAVIYCSITTMLLMTTNAMLSIRGKKSLLLMSVTIKQSDVSNNVRMGVLCYCYTFCGRSVLIGLVSPLITAPRLILGQYRHQQLLGGTRVLDLSGSSSRQYRPCSVLTLTRETFSVWISRVRGRMRGNR